MRRLRFTGKHFCQTKVPACKFSGDLIRVRGDAMKAEIKRLQKQLEKTDRELTEACERIEELHSIVDRKNAIIFLLSMGDNAAKDAGSVKRSQRRPISLKCF